MTEKQMVIVVEGTDCVGKSTFCEELAKEHDLLIVHIDGSFPNTQSAYYDEIKLRLMEAKVKGLKGIIFDRSWLGEQVYGYIYRDKPRISIPEIIAIENVLNVNYDFMKMLIVNEPEKILKQKVIRGEKEIENTIEDIKKVQDMFMNANIACSPVGLMSSIIKLY